MFLFYKMLAFAKRTNSTWTDSSSAILFHGILKQTTKNWDLKGTESAGMWRNVHQIAQLESELGFISMFVWLISV